MLAALMATHVSSNTKHCGLRCGCGYTRGQAGLANILLVFCNFVNELIRIMKGKCQTEPLLEWLHILVLMDDTCSVTTVN